MKKNRGHNEGTLEKCGKKWYVRYTDYDGSRKRKATGETDRRKAESFMEKFVAARNLEKKLGDETAQLHHVKARLESEISGDKAELASMKRVKLSEMYHVLFETEEGSKYRPKGIIPATERQYERFTRKLSDWALENRQGIQFADQVSHELAGEFLEHILKTGSPDLHRRCLTFLRFVFERFVEMGRLFSNPFDGYRNERNIKVSKKRVLTDEETEALHKVLSEKDLETRSLFTLGEETGQRFGDCCRFKWEYIVDLPVKNGTVKFLVYKPSKTKKYGTEVRLPLSERALKVIAELKAAKLDKVWLHPKWRAEYEKNNTVPANKAATAIFKEAGINTVDGDGNTVVGFHSLRHGFVSKLALSSANVPMTTIMSFVGHTREKMSEYYSHASVASQVSAIGALDGKGAADDSVPVSRDFYERIMKRAEKGESFEKCVERLISHLDALREKAKSKAEKDAELDRMLDEVLAK